MKKNLKKVFFYFVSLIIGFLNYFQADGSISSKEDFVPTLYGIQGPFSPVETWISNLSYILMFFVVPIIFIIG